MKNQTQQAKPIVFTIGHSTRALEAFIHLLQVHAVQKVLDIRTVPRSRRNPQFNRETLPMALSAVGIGYVHASGLGGFRHARRDSPNTGWKNASFRGFADYMQTQEFEENLQTLVNTAMREQITLMCAEAVPWRCHRSLIADALLVRGIQVEHIFSETNHKPHKLTSWAQVKGTNIIYPPSKLSSRSKGDASGNRSLLEEQPLKHSETKHQHSYH